MLNKSLSTRSSSLFATLSLVGCVALIATTILPPYPSSPKSLSLQTHSAGVDASSLEAGQTPHLNLHEATAETSESTVAKSTDAYGRLPMSFEVNQGQTDQKVKFLARGQDYGLFLTSTGAEPTSDDESAGKNSKGQPAPERAVLSLDLKGANPSPRITGVDQLPGKTNYFIGNDQRKWRSGVPTYSKVRYERIYPNIDLIYYGNQQQLEYDFVVAPGANPDRIKLSFSGADTASVAENGNLVLSTSAGDVIQQKPVAYQEVDGQRHQVAALYDLEGDEVSFKLGSYDRTKPLIIDPVLAYSTFLGGSSVDSGLGIAVDAQGNAYLTGETLSADFPIVGGFQPVNGGTDIADAFVVKLNPTGTAIVYSTYLGGSENEIPNAIKIDDQGHAYITGTTFSDNFPTTVGAFQRTTGGRNDGFVSKLNPSGSALIYSTLIGGDNGDTPLSIALRTDGRAYVVGRTFSTNFQSFPLNRHGSPAYKSLDGAENWSASSTGLTASSVGAFGLDPTTSNVIYAATNIGVFKSTNAGATWTLTGGGNPASAPPSANEIVVDPSNPNVVYIASNYGVFKSTDGGTTYTEKNTGFVLVGVNAMVIDPSTPTTLYAGGIQQMYKSINGGDSWVEIHNGIVNTNPDVNELVIDPSNPAIVYMGTRDGMYKTTNSGALWTPINSGPITDTTQITALVIDPLNPATLYAGSQSFSSRVHKTTNGGTTWTDVGNGTNGLPFVPINALGIDPITPEVLYVATTTGIYKSTNGGVDWVASNTGLANTFANAVAVDRNNSSVVYAGTSVSSDAFAVRVSATGSNLEQVLSFGGDNTDEARGVATDGAGMAYLVGTTDSPTFPVVNAFQPTKGASNDAFLAKLNDSGTGFVYSTFLGGSGPDQGRAIAVRENSPYITGLTSSADFPVLNAFQPTQNALSIEAFVTKFNSTGSALEFSSYHGGRSTDQGLAIALDSEGAILLTGVTSSPDLPTVNPTQPAQGSTSTDAFITKVDPSGGSRVYSSYLGGSSSDQGNGIAVDAFGSIYVIGTTNSANFPTVNSLFPKRGLDAFITKIAISLLKFTSSQYTAVESAARVQVDVTRTGDTSAAATIDYATSDTAGLTNCNVINGIASSRCDYATSVGTVRFAAGETSKTISIPIVDDAYAEGNESFTITLRSVTGAAMGTPSTATVTINDNETSHGTNPIDLTAFFVRQQYVDFLNREPDPGGDAAWQAVINNCPPGDTTCDRIHVSSAFFRSPEFQERGYFVYRFYPVSFGRKPDYVEFMPDIAKVSGFLSDAELEAAKVAFIAEFMSRPAFVTTYNGLNNTQYVDTLLTRAGVAPHQFRDFWIAALGNGTRTRATVLRDIAESPEVYNKYYNQAFVVMQYFGYLRREPDALYTDWIQVLDSSGDYRGMINGFMNSAEYRARFGP